MFTRFTSMLHHAVEALVPAEPLKKEFVAHWKDITSYFTEHKEHRVSVDQTRIPKALEAMLEILVCEEEDTQGLSGPCVEYLLRNDIVDTLYSLARADCPPGMKQCVLQFFTKLLSRIKQPLLPYMNVHTPMQRLVRLCGETRAGPTETEEVHFLCTLCAKVKTEPHLVSFFLQQNVKPVTTVAETLPGDRERPGTSSFLLIESLLKLMSSADARVAVKACEGVLLCTTLTDPACVHSIVHSTDLCEFLTKQLCALYDKLPKMMDPAHLESVDVHWGLDVTSDVDDMMKFPGKRPFVSFLSWLDFCDQLGHVAHPLIASTLAARLHAKFLTLRLEPAILQTSETGSITATALLTRCLSLLTAPALIQAFGRFVLGEDLPEASEDRRFVLQEDLPKASEDKRQPTDVEPVGSESGTEHKLKNRLIERCDSLSEEVCLSSLKLFEALLVRPTETVVHNLILRDLLPRSYCRHLDEGEHSMCDTTPVVDMFDLCDNACVARDVCTSGATQGAAMQGNPPDILTNSLGDSGDNGVGGCQASVVMTTGGGCEDRDVEAEDSRVVMTTQCGGGAGDTIVTNGDISAMTCDVINTDTSSEEDMNGSMGTPAACPSSQVYYDMHEIVASFLDMLPNEVKSSYQSADAGYDTYLRDAHRQFSDMSSKCAQFGWPTSPVCHSDSQTQPACQGDGQMDTFHEGPFLKMLLDKLSRTLQQSYDINLQLTSIVARLALLPHPNIHEYLLNPLLPLQDNCRTLPVVLRKVAADVEHRMKSMPSFQVRLMVTRKHLLGMSSNIRREEDEHILSGTIVLEEFCKELAAIVFVKYHEATAGM